MASNDSWLNKDTVAWNRKTRGTASGIDDPVLNDAIGFPSTAVGDVQQSSGDRRIQVRGVEVAINAIFFTAQSGIQSNDTLVHGSKTYTVLNVIPFYGPNNQVDHYECSLIYET